MSNSTGSIKLLARRFVSLPPDVRTKVAARLLRWREENQETMESEAHRPPDDRPRRKSLLEQFWDEVEAAHDDGLYPVNPFADERSQPSPLHLKDNPARYPAYN